MLEHDQNAEANTNSTFPSQSLGKKVSPAGNRTPVFRVTGGDTVHYTNEDWRNPLFAHVNGPVAWARPSMRHIGLIFKENINIQMLVLSSTAMLLLKR